jgi:hypothetical protein
MVNGSGSEAAAGTGVDFPCFIVELPSSKDKTYPNPAEMIRRVLRWLISNSSVIEFKVFTVPPTAGNDL